MAQKAFDTCDCESDVKVPIYKSPACTRKGPDYITEQLNAHSEDGRGFPRAGIDLQIYTEGSFDRIPLRAHSLLWFDAY